MLRERWLHGFQTHAQATYGLMNYPEFSGDVARVGIGLYGVLSQQGQTRTQADLQPGAGAAGAGGAGTARCGGRKRGLRQSVYRPHRYGGGRGDGRLCGRIPRSLSGSGAHVLIHGQRAPVIGRICMDQLLADVSGIVGVKQGDVVTLIGRDGSAERRLRTSQAGAAPFPMKFCAGWAGGWDAYICRKQLRREKISRRSLYWGQVVMTSALQVETKVGLLFSLPTMTTTPNSLIRTLPLATVWPPALMLAPVVPTGR